MKVLYKYALIVAINLLIFLILLKIADTFFEQEETGFQFQHKELVLTEYPPNADYSVVPTEAIMREVDTLEKKEYRLRSDSNGFIIGPTDLTADDPYTDIIFFGGSTTECFFVDEDKRFPYLTGRLLSEQIGRRVSVKNAGLMGKRSMQSYLDFLVRGTQQSPKMVVMMHNVNDLVQLLYVGGYFDGPASRRMIVAQEQPEQRRNIIVRIASRFKNMIFPNIYRVVTEQILSEPETVDEWEGWRSDIDVEFDLLMEEFQKSLSLFVTLAKVNDIDVVLMTQFNRFNLDDDFIIENYYRNAVEGIPHENFFEYYHAFNEVIRNVAEREGIMLIDLANEIPSTNEYLYDAVHLNTRGSILAAEVISNAIYYKLQ